MVAMISSWSKYRAHRWGRGLEANIQIAVWASVWLMMSDSMWGTCVPSQGLIPIIVKHSLYTFFMWPVCNNNVIHFILFAFIWNILDSSKCVDRSIQSTPGKAVKGVAKKCYNSPTCLEQDIKRMLCVNFSSHMKVCEVISSNSSRRARETDWHVETWNILTAR